MTPERAKELLPVIQAYAEGKKLEFRWSGTGEWHNDPDPNFDAAAHWRVKPEPREWWLVKPMNFAFDTQAQAEDFVVSNPIKPNIIVHVREVLP